MFTKINTSAAILIGSVLISFSILVSSGIITIKGLKTGKTTAEVVPNPQVTQAPQQPTVTLKQVQNTFSKALIKFGDTSKKVVVVEVADPSCPYCQIAAGLNPELNKQAGSQFTLVSDGGSYVAPVPEVEKLVNDGKAAFAFLYTPGHGNGEMGTKALYCAFENKRFWEVHNLLMTSKGYDLLNNTVKNDKTKSGDVARFLSTAIDPSVMKQCLDSGKYDSRLTEDISLASGLGISGTPGFFVNAKLYAGAYSFKDMESTINEALK